MAEWKATELAQAASRAFGRPYSAQAASSVLQALAHDGLVARTFNNKAAPWAYTPAGEARARELGVGAL